MADRLWRAQVRIPMVSGIPEDDVINTWYFDDDDDPIQTDETCGQMILDNMLAPFYQAIDGEIFPITMGPTAFVKMYDMAEPEERQIKHQGTFALTPRVGVGEDPLPNEVAVCLSFHAAFESGINVQRRRGRIYLGPICQSAAAKVGSQLRPKKVQCMDKIRDAAATMAAGYLHPASPGYRLRWSQYSPTSRAQGATVGESFNDVIAGFVDDAFDTQRRRGCDATDRSSWVN